MTGVLVSILIMVIIATLITAIYTTVRILKTKHNNDLLNEALDAVLDATDQVSQTYVDSLKGKDEFNEENQKEALRKSINKAIELMPQAAQEFIKKHSGDLKIWIESKIESYLWRSSGKAQNEYLDPLEFEPEVSETT